MRFTHSAAAPLAALALVTALGAACAGAPDTFVASGPGAGTVITDDNVAGALTTANSGAIEVAQLGVAEAESNQVREFAQRLIDEHRAAGERTEGLLNDEGIASANWALTTDLQNNTRETLEALRTYDGADFDREFMEWEVQNHRYVIETIENTLIPAARDGDLEDHLEALLPTLRDHLRSAQSILDSL